MRERERERGEEGWKNEVTIHFRRLVASFSPWWPGFNPRSVHMGFLVDKVALGQDFSE
jgi:hypothetical protein